MATKPQSEQARDRLKLLIQRPLAAWIRTMSRQMFDAPESAEACAIMTEAIAGAVQDTIAKTPFGAGAIQSMCTDLQEKCDARES